MKRTDIKINLILVLLMVGLGLIAGRLVFIQVVKADVLRSLAQKRHISTQRLMPLRGNIVDRKGEVLAMSVPAVSIYVHPHKLAPGKKQQLCDALERHTVTSKCRSMSDASRFVWLARDLPQDEHRGLLEELRDIDAVGWKPGAKRQYPKGTLAGQLVGFVGLDGEGLEGIEHAMEAWLKPQLVDLAIMQDARRRMLLHPEDIRSFEVKKHAVQLTLDATIQARVERALREATAEFGGKSAIALVAEAETGAIRAAAITPAFDPNSFRTASPPEWRARFATDAFEPGSTVKPLVLAAALEAGSSLNDIIFAENGRLLVDKHEITDGDPHGWLSLRNVVVQSSNIGVVKIGHLLGQDLLYETYRKFGFGARLDVGLPGESSGILRPAARWSALDFAAAAFGQGLSVSPLQLLQAYLVVANDGVRVKPRLVQRVFDADSGRVAWEPEVQHTAEFANPAVFDQVRQVIRSVVLEGTGKQAAVEGLAVGGKTGTAQKPDLEFGGYRKDAYVAWFAGMFPIENPKWVIVVLVDEPETNIYGGTVAAPVFAKVAETIAIREGLLQSANTRSLLTNAQLPDAHVVAVQDVDAGHVPDFRGLSLKHAGHLATQSDIAVAVHGSGIVIDQDPAPGVPIQDFRVIKLVLGEKPV